MSPFAQAVRRLGSRRSVVALIVGGAVAVAVVVPSVSAGPESGAAPAPETGCPNDKALTPINISQVSLPQGQLLIDKQEITPNPVTSSTQSVRVRVHITACSGRSVGGALVYAEPTPFEQFAPEEQPTAADGWATLTLDQAAVLAGVTAAAAPRHLPPRAEGERGSARRRLSPPARLVPGRALT